MIEKTIEHNLKPTFVNNLFYNLKTGKWSFEDKEINCENCIKLLETLRKQLDKNTNLVRDYIQVIDSLRKEIDEMLRFINFL